MNFAKFKGTHVGLPLDVIERTGIELETKYFKNRDASSKLTQAMSNAKVEDRNIVHLARATQDVDNIFKGVEGKWHYATDAVYKATDRVTNDKVLNASLEDYQKSATQQTEIQKQVNEGTIGQDAADAYARNNKRYNTNAIEIDQETGQLKNRWGTPPPPPKPDMDKMTMDIIKVISDHPDSLAVGLAAGNFNGLKKGDPLYQLFQEHPRLEGHILETRSVGVDGNKIASAVHDWIKTNPEVKAYYNYINDANTFDMITQKDASGQYAKDETGNFIQRELTQNDFATLGIQVDENWNFKSNKIAVPDENGTLKLNEIENIGANLKNTPMYKALIDAGFSDKQALQRIYTSVATDVQTDAHVNFAANFGYAQLHTSTHEDIRYWKDDERRHKKEEEANIFSGLTGQTPAFKSETFDVKDNLKYIDNLRKELESIPTGEGATRDDIMRYSQIQGEIENRIGADRVLRQSYLNTPEGQNNLNDVYRDLYNNLSRENKNKLKNDPELIIELKNYVAGLRDESPIDLSRTINTTTAGGSPFVLFAPKRSYESDVDINKLNNARHSFSNNLTKNIQTKGIEVSAKTTTFVDDKGKYSAVNDNIADWIIKAGNSFNIVYNASKSTKANKGDIQSTVDDYYRDNEIDFQNYQSVVEFGEPGSPMAGKIIMRIVPRYGTATASNGKLEDFDRLVIEPNTNVKTDVMLALADLVENQAANDFGKRWADEQRNSAIFDPVFGPLKYEIVTNRISGAPDKLTEERNLYGVPVKYGNDRSSANFKIIPMQIGNDFVYGVYQLDIRGNVIKNTDPTNTSGFDGYMFGRSLTEIQNMFYNQYK